MWRLATIADAARTGAAAGASRSALLIRCAPHIPSFLSPLSHTIGGVRHGSSSTQSHRASHASHRASGSTYRKPKGREGDKNPWHQKEGMPEIPTFAEARLPPHIRRKLAAAARVKASHNSGATSAAASLIDFEVVDDTVQRIRGKDSKRPDIKRAKSPLHRALKLEAARAQAARNKQAAEADALDWDPSEQLAAESEADSFVALQSMRDEISLQREIMQEDMKQQGLSDADTAKALEEFDAEAAQALARADEISLQRKLMVQEMKQQGLSEADTAKALEEFDAEAAQAMADAEATQSSFAGVDAGSADATPDASAPPKRQSRPRKKTAPAPPTFGVQTLLAFLAEYDFAVQLPEKSAAATKGRKKRSPSAATDLVATDPSASSDPDPSSRESLLRNPLNQSVLVYDVASRFSFADFIVVVKTNSARQMRHVAEASYKMVRQDDSEEQRESTRQRRGDRRWRIVCSFAHHGVTCLTVSPPFPCLSSVPFPERLSLQSPRVESRGSWSRRLDVVGRRSRVGVLLQHHPCHHFASGHGRAIRDELRCQRDQCELAKRRGCSGEPEYRHGIHCCCSGAIQSCETTSFHV